MHLLRRLFLLPALCSLVFSDVVFQAPLAGDTREVGQGDNEQFADMTILFGESGTPPSISDFVTYELYLCAGSNSLPSALYLIAGDGGYTAGQSSYYVPGTIPGNVGGSSQNAYFLGISSKTQQGSTVVNYSGRFALKGMTGTFSDAINAALAGVSGLSGPATNTTLNTVSQDSTPTSSPQSVAATSILQTQLGATSGSTVSPATASNFASSSPSAFSSASNSPSSPTTMAISQSNLSSKSTSHPISTSETGTLSTTNNPTVPTHSVSPQSSKKSTLSTNVIAGIIIASIAGLSVLGGAFYYFRRRQRIEVLEIPRKHQQLAELPGAEHQKTAEMEIREEPQELSANRYSKFKAVRYELYGDDRFETK